MAESYSTTFFCAREPPALGSGVAQPHLLVMHGGTVQEVYLLWLSGLRSSY